MPKTILDPERKQIACERLTGLSRTLAREEARKLAAEFGCHPNRIYDATKHVRPARKQRADKGRRAASLLSDPAMRTIAEFVIAEKLNPAQAIEKAIANGHHPPVSHGTTVRYFREHGLNRRQIRSGRRAYRSFEAAAPGDIFQFDISGVKERWLDIKTRRLLHVTPLEVSRNHPNTKVTRIGVWKFVLIDDHSRYLFVRFIARPSIDSKVITDFLLEGFREMGIPKLLYTDNDSKILSKQMRRAESILNRAFIDSGGFLIDPHLAGNPQATGKVERAHQWIEEQEKLIGAADREVSIDVLDVFANRLSRKHNWEVSRATGMMPAIRFRARTEPMRMPLDETFNSAFKSIEIERELRPDMTFSYDGVSYQVPNGATILGERNPFLDWIGEKIAIVWPSDADYYVVLGLAKLQPAERGAAIEVERRMKKADAAGEFKTAAESIGQRAAKELVASAKAKRAERKAAGTRLLTPGIDIDFVSSAAASAVEIFPSKKVTTNPELLAALGSDVVPPSMVSGRLLDYYEALSLFIDEELLTKSEFDRGWLLAQFSGDANATVNENDLRAMIVARNQMKIVEAKSA